MKWPIFLIALFSLNLAAVSAEKENAFLKKTLLLQGKTPLYKSSYLYKNMGQGAGYGALAGGVISAQIYQAIILYYMFELQTPQRIFRDIITCQFGCHSHWKYDKSANTYDYSGLKICPSLAISQAFGAAFGAGVGTGIGAISVTMHRYYVPWQINKVLTKSMPELSFKDLSPHAAMLCYAAYEKDFGMIAAALQHEDAQIFFKQPGARQAVAHLAKLTIEELQAKMII